MTTTMQAAFNKAFLGVYGQGAPSLAAEGTNISDGLCHYQLGELRCGIGHLLPKRFLRPSLEGKGVCQLIYEYKPLADDATDDGMQPLQLQSAAVAQWFQRTFDLPTKPTARYFYQLIDNIPMLAFLRDLQNAHDLAAKEETGEDFRTKFCTNMRKVAVDHGLDAAVIDQSLAAAAAQAA